MKTLKELRQCLNISREQLAYNAEISMFTVINLEQGKIALPQDTIRQRLELVLGSRIDWIKTCGLHPTKYKSWYELELSLRKVLSASINLEDNQPEMFLSLVEDYLKSFRKLIAERDESQMNLEPFETSTYNVKNRLKKSLKLEEL